MPARKALALVRLADPHLPFVAITRSVRRHDLAAVVKGLEAGIAVAVGPGEVAETLQRELESARRRRAEGKAHRLLLAQQAITDHLAAAQGPESLLNGVLGALGETLGFACGAIWLPEGDGPTLRCAASWVAPDAGPAVPPSPRARAACASPPAAACPAASSPSAAPCGSPTSAPTPRSRAPAPRATRACAPRSPCRSATATIPPACSSCSPATCASTIPRPPRCSPPSAASSPPRSRARASTSLRDPLTGLPTAALLEEHVELALARARRSGASVMVLHLRLLAGPDLLAPLAMRVTDVLRATDVLARTGPAELGVMLADLALRARRRHRAGRRPPRRGARGAAAAGRRRGLRRADHRARLLPGRRRRRGRPARRSRRRQPTRAARHGTIPAMAHRVVVRTGPRVERLDAASLDAALDLIEERARALARGPRRAPVELRFKTFEPVQQVAHRLELRGEGGVRAGIDVRGDGSVEAWTGRLRRQVVAQEPGESAYAALRRTLEA